MVKQFDKRIAGVRFCYIPKTAQTLPKKVKIRNLLNKLDSGLIHETDVSKIYDAIDNTSKTKI